MGLPWKSILLACLLTALSGCDLAVFGTLKDADDSVEAEVREALRAEVRIPVEAAHPERSDVYSFFDTTARIVAERRVDVIAKGIGQCIEMMVEEGDTVKAGAVLAELEKDELHAQMRQTEVTIKQQRAAYERAKKGLLDKVGTPVEVENTKLALDQSEANLALQNVQLANLTIKAPIGGVVTMRAIQPGMMVTSGAPVFTIVDPTSFTLPIFFPERQLAKLHVGQEARVRLDSAGDTPLNATILRINPSVDPASGTVKVTLAFTDATQASLRESAFAKVKLVMERRENVLVVSKDSLIEENTRDYLMVVVEEEAPSESGDETMLVAQRVEVETGLEDSDNIEVLSGISEDTLVVTLGQHTLKSGSEVHVTNIKDEVDRYDGLSIEDGLALAEARTKLKEEERKAEEEAEKEAEQAEKE